MFELFQSEKSQEYYFRLKAKNGQIILSSQGYSSKAGAANGIESVKKNAELDERFERKETESGKWRFNIKAANSQIIGTSQNYASKDGMENGIQSVMANAPGAEVKDLTVA
ncbi:MAG: YegP family protein [Bacteroidia bacterium]|nr:YegP family protein [Bacteroidia bacterium]